MNAKNTILAGALLSTLQLPAQATSDSASVIAEIKKRVEGSPMFLENEQKAAIVMSGHTENPLKSKKIGTFTTVKAYSPEEVGFLEDKTIIAHLEDIIKTKYETDNIGDRIQKVEVYFTPKLGAYPDEIIVAMWIFRSYGPVRKHWSVTKKIELPYNIYENK